MAYADQQMSGNRIVAIIIVALIHVALGYALITGLAYNAVQQVVERVTTIDIEEPPPPRRRTAAAAAGRTCPTRLRRRSHRRRRSTSRRHRLRSGRRRRFRRRLRRSSSFRRRHPRHRRRRRSQARGASPTGQAGWARRIQSNYPFAVPNVKASRVTVGVTITVGTDGRVASCRVSNSQRVERSRPGCVRRHDPLCALRTGAECCGQPDPGHGVHHHRLSA